MPSSITHQLVAEEARKRLPPEIGSVAEEFADEYLLGCQGPDLFFFYRIGSRSEYNLGKFLHRYRVYDAFLAFAEAIAGKEGAPRFNKEQKKRALAYVLGYIAHYCTDSAFHPFVYGYLSETHAEKQEHQQIENDWDVYFLRELRGRETEGYSFGFSRKALKQDGTAARLYAYLASRLGREEVTPARFDRGVKNFTRYLRAFHKKCYGSQKRWQRAEKIFHAKRFLSRLYPRKEPAPEYLGGEQFLACSEGKGDSADALFRLAVDESARLMLLFVQSLEKDLPLPREEFSNSFLTGKPVE